ncbi:hypothetical protein CNR22_03850 [Sphingobacteriaceae bacterium]|nr:hypothetical protein CNR22_03850 [Sphingobacteriaceae bacterium]
MNYIKTSELKLVGKFYFNEGEIIIWHESAVKTESETILLNEANEVYFFANSYLVIMDEFKRSRWINRKLGIDKIIDSVNSLSSFFDETTIFQSYWNDSFTELRLRKLDLVSEKEYWNINKTFTPAICFEDFYLAYGIGDMYKIANDTNHILWTFSFDSLTPVPKTDNYQKDAPWTVKNCIGVLEEKLWVALNHHTIIALSMKDGTLAHFINEIPGFHCPWLPSAIPLPEATKISLTDNKLAGLMWEFYWEIDPKTGSINLEDHTEYFKDNNIRNDRELYILDKELIFFVCDTSSKVVCFNRETQKLDWHYTFEEKSQSGKLPGLLEIKGDRTKFGVKDLKHNLYIFENEDN